VCCRGAASTGLPKYRSQRIVVVWKIRNIYNLGVSIFHLLFGLYVVKDFNCKQLRAAIVRNESGGIRFAKDCVLTGTGAFDS